MPPHIPDHNLLRHIGQGSYGEVWLAHNALGTARAVKVVHRSSFDSDRPYEREFAGIQKFEPISRSHEGFVDILHVGRSDESGFFYYVMELADASAGVSGLAAERKAKPGAPTEDPVRPLSHPATFSTATYSPHTLASDRDARGRLPISECLPIFLTLTSALGHLHKRGLLHRDIKPANIIFVGGVAKLADIGLVAEAGEARTFVGTEGFIPPEGPGTPQADLYTLAKTFYEVATGKDRLEFPSLPLERGHPEENRALVELNAIFLKACEHDLKSRYASADEMHAELALLQSGRSVTHLHQIEGRLRVARQIGLVALVLALVTTTGVLLAAWRARVESKLRAEAQAARSDAETKLFESLLVTARAERRSGQAGARWTCLDAITRATALMRGSTNFTGALPELRSEVITALALPDFRELRRWRRGSPTLPATYEFCLDGAMERVARVLSNRTISISRVLDGVELQRLTLPDDGIRYVGTFSPGGTYLYAYSLAFEKWAVLRVADNTVIEHINDPARSSMVTFSPDERWLVYGRKDGAVECRDLHGGPARRWPAADWPITLLAFGSDGARLGIGGGAKEFHVVEMPSGQKIQTFRLPGGLPFELSWSGTQAVAVASADGPLYVFDLASTNPAPQILKGHQAETVSCSVHPSGEFAVSSSWDNTTRLWELRTAQLRATHRIWGKITRFNPDGTRFILLTETEEPALYEFADRRSCRHFGEPAPVGVRKAPLSVSFSPDGGLLLAPEHDHVRLLAAADGKELARIPGGPYAAFEGDGGAFLVAESHRIVRWPLHRDEVGTLWVGPPQSLTNRSGNWISSARNGVTAVTEFMSTSLLFDKGRPLPDLERRPAYSLLTLSLDGRWAAAKGGTGLRIWDLAARKLVHTVEGDRPFGYAFSPDGRHFAANNREALHVWEVEAGRLVLNVKWPAPNTGQARLAWSPDGRVIATTLNQYQIGLLDVATGELLTRLEDPDPQFIEWLEFHPDGGQLAVACSTHVVHVWDLRAIRSELALLGLDWNHPPLPPARTNHTVPLRVNVVGR